MTLYVRGAAISVQTWCRIGPSTPRRAHPDYPRIHSACTTESNLLSVWVCSAKSPWLVALTTTINRTFLRINSDGRPDSPKARRHKTKGDRGTDHRDQNNGIQRRDAIALGIMTVIYRAPKRQSGLIGTGFNPLAQAPKGLSDDLFRVILPYPFLHPRRKRQRLVRFKAEG